MSETSFILTLTSDPLPGIIAAVSTAVADLGGNITETNQHWDRPANRFFLRVAFVGPQGLTAPAVEQALAPTAEKLGLDLNVVDAASPPKIIAMVSKFDHALLHLLYQIRVGWLRAEVVAIVSNHEDARRIADHEGIRFVHLPVTPETKPHQEAALLELVAETEAELVILARYMQVLSDDLTRKLSGRAINIHHSFLPAFKGANPYKQAYTRGVKLIGATSHYVTADLDEGPIIEQDVARVSHADTGDDLVAIGRDTESRVLARAVKSHLERRVLLCGSRTVVFTK
ncbi:MAG TPA: formyltetrahydrofolate deformylase [Amaricoccus sp.]|uniref:formyltetrahydrofolate deformylase n=1 Tax=Amaricoccus sp. TaxID=1872485 RepID=UPI002CBAB4E2|nr:formyltetrahydrofolate deformylase [Amaricoccus sp.]HMR54064.1 formyltetrahydrofolate deformylase [Amaricoccus sp.]HMR61293.1 formyltetrahydrofolate deformylase [Amaricoccus sp.]HMU01050.1 formyltetrahydrofolate deformylase [Amaricoccus sp.]